MKQVVYELSLKDLLTPKINDANKSVNQFETTIHQAQGAANSLGNALGIAFGTAAIVGAGKEIFNVARSVDSLKISLNQITRGEGEETFQYLTDFSNKLGINIESAAKGFKTIGAAANGTALEGEQAVKIFERISEASAVLGLSSYETEGALLAIGQMISKGNVQAEELRGQLGERLPGAFQIMARAMGVSTQQLDKMLQKGQVVAADVLPKLADQLGKEFSGGLPAAMLSLNAETGRAENSIFDLKNTIGQDLKPAFIDALQYVVSFTGSLKEGYFWVKEHSTEIKYLATAATISFALYKGAVLGTMVIQSAQTLITYGQIAAMYVLGTAYETASIGAKILAAAQYALNAAFASSGIGLLVIGIAALITSLIYAYNHAEAFRAKLWGFGFALVEFGRIVADVFAGVGKSIAGALTFNPQMVMAGLNDTIAAVRNAGERLGNAANEGYTKGIANFKAGNLTTAAPMDLTSKGKSGKIDNTPALKPETKGAQGQKAVTINIKIEDLVKTLNINTTNIQEGTAKIREMIAETLMAATNDAQLVGGI